MRKSQGKFYTDELKRLLEDIGGCWTSKWSDSPQGAHNFKSPKLDAKAVTVSIQPPSGAFRGEVRCLNFGDLTENDRRMIRDAAKLFNRELTVLGGLPENREIWNELGRDRLLRVAVRMSSSDFENTLSMVKIFEEAARQTYEGDQFTGSVILPKYSSHKDSINPDRFTRFAKPSKYRELLLNQKWVRPFLMDGSFALLAGGTRKTAWGFVNIDQPSHSKPMELPHSPTAELDGLYEYQRDHAALSIISASSNGEIYFTTSNNFQFVKTKGRWRYRNWEELKNVLRPYSREVGDAIFRLVRRSSYYHQGSLFILLDSQLSLKDVVGGFRDQEVGSRNLGVFPSQMKIHSDEGFRVLKSASQIDGAVILDKQGIILDMAAMVQTQSEEAWEKNGSKPRISYPGARSTAAANASLYGLAIKISDDGPIEVYEKGERVLLIS